MAALKGPDAAAPLFGELAGLRDYYGYLAADRLHQDYRLNIRPTVDDPQVLAALLADPGVIRAHALFDCEMTDDAGADGARRSPRRSPRSRCRPHAWPPAGAGTHRPS